MFRFVAVTLATLIWCSQAPWASAQSTNLCVQQHIAANAGGTSLGIAPTDAEQLIQQVATSVGLRSSDLQTIPCGFARKAQAFFADGTFAGVPRGRYVVYNDVWVREVIGADRVQAIALFGHELGHFVNGHFGDRSNIDNQTKETEADQFAGCAVARMGGSWASVEGLFSRIRAEQDDRYPNRLQSLDAARRGFDSCGAPSAAPTQPASAPLAAQTTPLPPVLTAEMFDALMALDNARIEQLFARGWNANSTLDSEGNTALHDLMMVCERNRTHDPERLVQVARTLIRLGVSKTAENRWHDTPLSIARTPRYCGPNHPVIAVLQ